MNANVRPDAIRPAPWWLFVLLLAANTVLSVIGNHWFLRNRVWEPVYVYSHGLVNVTLLGNVPKLIVVVCGVLLWAGRRTPAEIGIEWRKIPPAVIYTWVLWIVVQFVMGGLYVGFGNPLEIANGWVGLAVLERVGRLLGQLLGNALYEEIVFRGFLLMQCVLLFRAQWPERPMKAFLAAVWLAAAVFALTHLSFHFRPDMYVSLSRLAWDQMSVFVGGCVACWIYWQTRNLFFSVGVHTVGNVPNALFAWQDLGSLTLTHYRDVIGTVIVVTSIWIALAWPRLPATNRRVDDFQSWG